MLARQHEHKAPQKRALQWLGKQLFNREDPAAFFDPLLEQLNPMWVQEYTPARVERILQETADTRTLVLKPARHWSGFEAGQHVNICTEIDGVRHQRTFSLSSSPALWHAQGRITLTIKRLPGGRVTNWIHDELETGAVIGLGEAFGDFQLPAQTTPLLFLAGGSGITPILSMLETLTAAGASAPATLLYCVRTEKDVIAREKLEAMAARHPNLTLTVIATNATDSPRYLTEEDLASVPGLHDREIYMCGPGGLMDLAQASLDALGVDAQRVHKTFFATPGAASLDGTDLGGTVRFAKSELEISSEGDANLLDMAEAAGLSPSYGCRMGICHQCSCKKTSGTVINRLTGKASGPGEENVQLCISVPQGPVTIEV